MIDRKLSSTATVVALVLAMAAPVASLAQTPPVRGTAAGAHSAGVRGGGAAPAGRIGAGAPAGRFGASGGAPMPSAHGAVGVQPQAHVNGGGGAWHGGGYGHGHRHGGGGFIPGAVAGGIIGGIIASDGHGYYGAPGYYDGQYYDDAGAAPPLEGDDATAYCMQTYRSYDPRSGTYLGDDGVRHPCP
jgi:BA14K-like protein